MLFFPGHLHVSPRRAEHRAGLLGLSLPRGTRDPLPIHPHPCTSIPSLGAHPAPTAPFPKRSQARKRPWPPLRSHPTWDPSPRQSLALALLAGGAGQCIGCQAAPPACTSGPGTHRSKPAAPFQVRPTPYTTAFLPKGLLRGYPPLGATRGHGQETPGICPSLSRCCCRGRGFPILQTRGKQPRAAGARTAVMKARLIRLTSCVWDGKGSGL